MTPLNLDKTIPYSIVGAPKAGSSSLADYLRANYYDVTEDELHFADADFASKLSLRTPLIILRDPIERAWSDFNFFKDWHDTLEKAVEWSRYEKHLKLWPYAKIFHLEDLIKLPNFPKHNHNHTKPKMTTKIRKELERLLK